MAEAAVALSTMRIHLYVYVYINKYIYIYVIEGLWIFHKTSRCRGALARLNLRPLEPIRDCPRNRFFPSSFSVSLSFAALTFFR